MDRVDEHLYKHLYEHIYEHFYEYFYESFYEHLYGPPLVGGGVGTTARPAAYVFVKVLVRMFIRMTGVHSDVRKIYLDIDIFTLEF